MDLTGPSSADHETVVQQLSYKFRDSLRGSSSRTLTRGDLEHGASRYYEKTKSTFGQVVSVDDDDLPQICCMPTAMSAHLQTTIIDVVENVNGARIDGEFSHQFAHPCIYMKEIRSNTIVSLKHSP